MAAYESEPWSELCVAIAGAAAALLGLLFVAVSINLEQVLRLASLLLVGLDGWLRVRQRRPRTMPAHTVVIPVVIVALTGAPLVAAGATLVAGTGGGLYWTVPALLAGFAGAVVNAWVLLVEILR